MTVLQQVKKYNEEGRRKYHEYLQRKADEQDFYSGYWGIGAFCFTDGEGTLRQRGWVLKDETGVQLYPNIKIALEARGKQKGE